MQVAYRPAPTRRRPFLAAVRNERAAESDRLRSSTRVRRPRGPGNPDRCSTATDAGGTGVCSPERPFGGNQLLGGSIGLSPLRSTLPIDFHVRTGTALHLALARLQPDQA